MKKYLLPQAGQFFKANLHCHTTISDGKMTPEEIKEAMRKMSLITKESIPANALTI